MSVVGHGEHLGVAEARAERAARLNRGGVATLAATQGVGESAGFDAMFLDLRVAQHQLPPSKRTIDDLDKLADVMIEAQALDSDAVKIKTAFTYFGQFLDHDITKQGETTTAEFLALPGNLTPKPTEDLFAKLANARTGKLDLDSLYLKQDSQSADPPRDPGNTHKMALGDCAPFGQRPGQKIAKDNDLKRAPNGVAQIGDPRNDENLVVGQMHVAFLRAHNTIVNEVGNFDAASKRMRRIFQRVVLHDFLPQICDPEIVKDVVANGRKFWNPTGAKASDVPIEFAAAGYRFGHSMIRSSYRFNDLFRAASLEQLFQFTNLMGAFTAVPENWIAEWPNFFDEDARPIDAQLTDALAKLPKQGGDTPVQQNLMKRLAARNLLRGFLFGLPTGQAVAQRMETAVLSKEQIQGALPRWSEISNSGFDAQTPLWCYVLAEANAGAGEKKGRLGPVGGRIVVETLHALIEASDDSILKTAPAANEQLTLRQWLQLSDPLN